jgi:predicted nucleotidyltransferase
MTASKDLPELQAILRGELPRLARRYGVARLGLFGSRVRGDSRADSDLDVLVSFHRNPGLLTIVTLENELSDLLGVRVDLVLADSLRPHAGRRILAEVVPV